MADKKLVTVKDLEKESGLEGRIIRRKIRTLGYKAPSGQGTKGYHWEANSAELKKIRGALKPKPKEEATSNSAA